MKLTDNQLPAAQTSGDMVTLNMGISDNPEDQLMILNVLSSTLYTKKPDAVLREYGCNAFDANVEAGKGHIPIEVGLPNKLEPSLRIRDFGFGMTEEQIANTFVKLGRSTKRDSNAFTGMLGIGSKAGFAYGDSFMVTSYTSGRKVVYNAFRDRGAPRLAKMLESATHEPDGIEIKVPVRMEDFQEFREKAERIYRYFKVRPKITGAEVVFQDTARIMSGTGWHYTGDGQSIAIMGNVGYDLTSAGMGGWSMQPKARILLDLGVELEFDIGQLEIAASREGLQYKSITKQAVLDRLGVIVKEIGDVFTKQIAGATCLWDAKRHYGNIFEQLGANNTRSLRDIVDGHIKWRGQVINTGRFDIENKEKDPEVNVFRVYKTTYSSRRRREPNAQSCYASDKTVLVINDLPSKKQSPARERGFFEDPANAGITDWAVFTFATDAAQKRYWKARSLEGAPTINLSSITPAVTATSSLSIGKSAYNPKHSAKVFVLDEHINHGTPMSCSAFWKQESVDLKKDKGLYVVLKGFNVCTLLGPVEEHPHVFLEKVKRLRKVGLIIGPIYGFKLALDLTRLGPGWKTFHDGITEALNVAGIDQIAADYAAAQKHSPIMSTDYQQLLPASSLIRKLFDLVETKRNPAQKDLVEIILKHNELAPWVPGIKLPKPSIDFTKLTNEVFIRYPMLDVVKDCLNLKNKWKIVVDYIKLVESTKVKQP